MRLMIDREVKKIAFLLLSLAALVINGCGLNSLSSPSMGATPGGAQDIGLARSTIAQGRVPSSSAFTMEGLFSEHDIPVEGPACAARLCLRTAVGLAPLLSGEGGAAYVQIGMVSGIDPETFRRDPLNLAVVVDVSGSMSDGKIDAVRVALHRLLDRLEEGDVLSIILFNSNAWVLLPPTPVSNLEYIKAQVNRISAGGSTNIEAGLRLGFENVQRAAQSAQWEGLSRRVMLFTDALPNTGRTDANSFIGLARHYANLGIGLTSFGVGIDFGHELVNAISQIEGGNYFFLQDIEKIQTVFDLDFDYLTTPLAYDLTITLTPVAGMRITDVYGVPDWKTVNSGVQIKVPTVFLSRRRGAIVARLEGIPLESAPSNTPLAMLSMSYLPPDVSNLVSTNIRAVYNGQENLSDGVVYFSGQGIRKAVALINMVLSMKEACDEYAAGNTAAAIGILEVMAEHLKGEIRALAVAGNGLEKEVVLVEKLIANMRP